MLGITWDRVCPVVSKMNIGKNPKNELSDDGDYNKGGKEGKDKGEYIRHNEERENFSPVILISDNIKSPHDLKSVGEKDQLLRVGQVDGRYDCPHFHVLLPQKNENNLLVFLKGKNKLFRHILLLVFCLGVVFIWISLLSLPLPRYNHFKSFPQVSRLFLELTVDK